MRTITISKSIMMINMKQQQFFREFFISNSRTKQFLSRIPHIEFEKDVVPSLELL